MCPEPGSYASRGRDSPHRHDETQSSEEERSCVGGTGSYPTHHPTERHEPTLPIPRRRLRSWGGVGFGGFGACTCRGILAPEDEQAGEPENNAGYIAARESGTMNN